MLTFVYFALVQIVSESLPEVQGILGWLHLLLSWHYVIIIAFLSFGTLLFFYQIADNQGRGDMISVERSFLLLSSYKK